MSKIIEKFPHREMCHIVEHENGTRYYIDSCYTLDHGYETMVFPYKKDGNRWKVIWCDVYDIRYPTREKMERYHMWLIEHLEEDTLRDEW